MTRRSKKSEMLEVRLSLDDKEALRAKAALEGSTVSATVRRLIADYLRQPEAEAVPSINKRIVMTLLKNPRKSLLAAGAFLVPALMLAPTAQADPITLSIEVEQSTPIEELTPEGVNRIWTTRKARHYGRRIRERRRILHPRRTFRTLQRR